MIILGIETSCDETAAAVVENGKTVLSNITATSAGLHARTGGVIPEQAARKQIEVIIPVIELALKEAKLSTKNIDAIAVTYGPGLIGSLLVGVETAKTLSALWSKTIIPVNHVRAHLYANWLAPEQESERVKEYKAPKFPAVGLVVSGGHTDLVLMGSHQEIDLLGATRDDAAGEAFDKTARLIGIPYPGGPNLAKIADQYINSNPEIKLQKLPRPIINEDNYDWSFSGLKTAALKEIKTLARITDINIGLADYAEISKQKVVIDNTPLLAAEIQEAIVDVLVAKCIKAIKQYQPKSFLLGGGVSANQRLRGKFEKALNKLDDSPTFYVPEIKYTSDNAAMIATAAFYQNNSMDFDKVNANPQLSITD